MILTWLPADRQQQTYFLAFPLWSGSGVSEGVPPAAVPTPAIRTATVAAESRPVSVAAELRTAVVVGENRTVLLG